MTVAAIVQSVSSSVTHTHGIISMNASLSLSLSPLLSSFSSLPLFSGQWKCACVQILSAVCNFWLWWRASAQPRASGFAAQPQSRHMKNCWVQAGLFLPFPLCVCVFECSNMKWKAVYPPHLPVCPTSLLLSLHSASCCPSVRLQWYVIAAACRTWTGWTVYAASWTSRRRRTAAASRGDTSSSTRREILCCGIWTTLRCCTHTHVQCMTLAFFSKHLEEVKLTNRSSVTLDSEPMMSLCVCVSLACRTCRVEPVLLAAWN